MGLRVVFAGTPDFALPSLKAVLKHHEVCAVYTKPDSPSGRGLKLQPSAVKQFVLEHCPSIPILQPTNLKDADTQSQLQNFFADVMIVIAYGLILPANVLSLFKYGCVNVHASLLPRWRGAAPIQRALLAGDHITGVTIMQIDQGLDTGAMLKQAEYTITATDTAQSLHDHLAKLGAETLIATLNEIDQWESTKIIQDHHLATYAAKITKDEAEINWHDTAEKIDRHIRAFFPWPGAFTRLKSETLKVWEAEIGQTEILKPLAGQVIGLTSKGIEVATQRGSLILKKLQLPGGKIITAQDFLNAKRHEIIIDETVLGAC